jgi:hypothetical protein
VAFRWSLDGSMMAFHWSFDSVLGSSPVGLLRSD